MKKGPFLLALFLLIPAFAHAASLVRYKISIDPKDLSGLAVEMRFSTNAPTVRVAMAAHPEYDDRYWRYIENVMAESSGKMLAISKAEDAVWKIDGARGEVIVRYRLHLPAAEGLPDAHKPFLTPTGGMVGDLHSLMYIVGDYARPAHLTLDMPADWRAASGMESGDDGRSFDAPTELMLDSPVMIGRFDEWDFVARGIPHKVVVWGRGSGSGFDALIKGIERLVNETLATFGPAPYRRYAFLFTNGTGGGLEHLSSVNIGHDFSRGLEGLFEQAAHEYFHAWNLMDVRPRERVGLQYKFAPPTTTLWWNEGGTIFFADYLLRRSGLQGEDASRVKHLETAMARYLSSPGYSTLSAEQASRGDTDPTVLGDTFASTHLQGELLTAMLDIMIRDRTNGRRNVVDIMRELARRYDYKHGITNRDIERTATRICPICPIHSFFQDHIYGAKQLDFDSYLSLVGLRTEITRSAALGGDGKPAIDLRISPLPNQAEFRIRITNPQSAWGRAGLHTGDRLIFVDGRQVNAWPDLRNWLRTLKIGDTGRLEIIRNGQRTTVDVPITGYETAKVALVERADATPRQKRLREMWAKAN
jgi:predicted metalloprotease with PDZ domain